MLLAFTPKPLPNWMVDSQVLPYAIDASNLCFEARAERHKEAFRDSMFEIRKLWDRSSCKRSAKNSSEARLEEGRTVERTLLIFDLDGL